MSFFPHHHFPLVLIASQSKIPYLLVNDTSCFPLPIKLNHFSANQWRWRERVGALPQTQSTAGNPCEIRGPRWPVPFTEKVSTQIDPKRYIQAHTVLKSVVHKYADLPVLVLGGKGDTLRKVAEG